MMTFKLHKIGLTFYIYKKGWSFISAHPLLRCLEKPLKRMKRIRQPHPRADIQRHSWGCTENDQTPRKGISYLYPSFLFLLVVFQTSSQKRIKRNMPILTKWLFSMFQMEPPIGDAKVLIINENRMVF